MATTPLTLESELKRVVLPLIAVTQDARWHPVGTAFVVSIFGSDKVLVVTAAHNLRFVTELDSPQNRPSTNVAPDFQKQPPARINLRSTRFYAGVEGPTSLVLAEMVQSWHIKENDVAFAVVAIPPDEDARFTGRLAIDSTPPSLGTSVTGLGYAGMDAEFASPPDYDRQIFLTYFKKRLDIRSGRIVRICPQGTGIHKWPGFLVDFGLDSGMSGGPLLDLSAEVPVVRGVIGGDFSESLDAGQLGSGAHAFGAMLWPALGTTIEIAVEMRRSGEAVRVERAIDLVRVGVLDDRGESLRRFRHWRTDSGETLFWATDGEELSNREDG